MNSPRWSLPLAGDRSEAGHSLAGGLRGAGFRETDPAAPAGEADPAGTDPAGTEPAGTEPAGGTDPAGADVAGGTDRAGTVGWQPTGHQAVDAALRAVVEVRDEAPAEQLPAYQAAHRTLRETLASIDEEG